MNVWRLPFSVQRLAYNVNRSSKTQYAERETANGQRRTFIPAALLRADQSSCRTILARSPDTTLVENLSMTESNRSTANAVATARRTEVAVLAGGCFWGVEEILRDVPGVIDTDVGYTGGWLKNPRYEDTHDSKSGHAEAIRVTFDPDVLSYEELLEKWFFRLHDPTTLNRQGNDIGTQYRSAIFPQSEEQRQAAERVKARVEASGRWNRPVTTSIEPASEWYSAEKYHQDYLRKNPGGYTCHWLRD